MTRASCSAPLRALRERVPELVLVTDVCLCEYTSHGHCGVVEDGEIVNDLSLDLLARTAVSHAEAGADVIAPSDMMDGRVGAIRAALDGDGFEHLPIVSYAAKYASAFYGPFREAAGSAPSFGDRRSYQLDPPNVREAMRECELDLAEGADALMIKPALPYLDVLAAARARLRRPDLRLQRERRVRDAEDRGRSRVARRAPGRAREPHCDQARGRGRDRHLLGEGRRPVALATTLFGRAEAVIPGGVNSPVRAMRAVGLEEPFFVRSASGAHIEDAEGRRYLDWVMSWGPLVFGHADPEVVSAVQAAAAEGTTFGAATEREVELAEEIVDAVPSVELVRLVSSGTEAAMSAVRLARGFTGRNRILKFSGCYHGHSDALLASAGSGLATLGIPSSPGVPAGATEDTVVCAFNDLTALAAAVERHADELACILVEPVAANMGVVPPAEGFLEALREACDRTGALLVFDEVITGFRLARGGAQELFGVTPDLTVLGKIVGGGLPLAAFGGRADVMSELAPSGPVYQAGTLSGNPLATAAALVDPQAPPRSGGLRAARAVGRRPGARSPPGRSGRGGGTASRLPAHGLFHHGTSAELRGRLG